MSRPQPDTTPQQQQTVAEIISMQPAKNAPATARPSAMRRLKDQLPGALAAALITALAFGAYTIWLKEALVNQLSTRSAMNIAALRDESRADVRMLNERLETTQQLLTDAVARRDNSLFMSNEELAKLDETQTARLAEAIAAKLKPYGALPQADSAENNHIDQVSERLATNIRPILDEMSRDQNLTRESVARYAERVSEEITGTLTRELAEKQQLNNRLIETAAIAKDSMRISQEMTALYLSQMKNEGLLTRLLTLPARVVQDTASLSIVSSSERKKLEKRLTDEMSELDRRLMAVQADLPHATVAAPAEEAAAPAPAPGTEAPAAP